MLNDYKSYYGFLWLTISSLFYIQFLHYKAHWIFFWIISIFWIIYIVFLISRKDLNKNTTLIIISIIVFISLLRIILRPYGTTMWGSDSYYDYATAITIYRSGWLAVMQNDPSTMMFHSDFPVIHFVGIISSLLLDIDLFTIVKWLPILLSVTSLFFIYLFTKDIYAKTGVSLISFFLFAISYSFLEMHSNFIKETVAFIFFSATIYSYHKAKSDERIEFVFLSLLFAGMTIISHHLSSFLLIIFFISLIVVQQFKVTNEGNIYNLSFILIIFTGTVGYWLYLKHSPLTWLVNSLQDNAQTFAIRSDSLPTSRQIVLKMKEFILAPFFALFSLSTIFNQHHKRANIELSLLVYGLFMGFSSIFYTQLIPSQGSGTVWGGRFMLFGYFALYILSAHTIYRILNTGRVKKILMIIFLISFALIQILNIPPSLYTHTNSPDNLDNGNYYILPSEQTAFKRFDFSGTIAVPNTFKVIYSALGVAENKSNRTIIGVSEFEIIQTVYLYDYMYVSRMSINDTDLYQNDERVFKMYDNRNILVYTKRGN